MYVASNYGPFGPVVGYGGAIIAAGGALFTMWGGRAKKWRPPDEDLPGTAQKIVLLLCGVLMVTEWYFALPEFIGWMISGVIAASIVCLICFLQYSELIGMYVYLKKVKSGKKVEDVRILGGRKLKPAADQKKIKEKVEIQDLLEGAAYDPDKLWERTDRQWVKKRVLSYFIATLVFGTSALTLASFSVQVLLTQRAASSVIRKSDAPGLK